MAELRIDDDTIVALAGELAQLRGVSVTEAVATALQQTVQRERDRRARARRMVELGREIRAHVTEPDRNDDEWLYDEDGLPA